MKCAPLLSQSPDCPAPSSLSSHPRGQSSARGLPVARPNSGGEQPPIESLRQDSGFGSSDGGPEPSAPGFLCPRGPLGSQGRQVLLIVAAFDFGRHRRGGQTLSVRGPLFKARSIDAATGGCGGQRLAIPVARPRRSVPAAHIFLTHTGPRPSCAAPAASGEGSGEGGGGEGPSALVFRATGSRGSRAPEFQRRTKGRAPVGAFPSG